MKRSNYFVPLSKQVAIDPNNISASYMEQFGMISRVGSGMYTHLPAGYKVFSNVKAVLNKHLLKAGCAEHQFPALQPTSIWREHGRLQLFGLTIFAFKDQHGKEVCLAPTHEILAAHTVKKHVHSYKDLPVRISQIQTKFRDETRPRGGVLRTREFTMHDLYSFDTGLESAQHSYDLIGSAYNDALLEMRIPFFRQTQADMGSIGGIQSHEYHVRAENGDDSYCDPVSNTLVKSIEIAHIFMLGDKYTTPIAATYIDRDGMRQPIFMCSYGMGIERVAATYIESYWAPREDLQWSWALSPYKILILGEQSEAVKLYDELQEVGYDVMIEDRVHLSFSQQLKEGMSMGFPLYIIFGKSFALRGEVEIRAPILNWTEYAEAHQLTSAIARLQRDIQSVEIARMSFQVTHIDQKHRQLYARIDNVRQLDHSFCKKLELGTDLLGNFDGIKKNKGTVQLKAGDYWVIPLRCIPNSPSKLLFHDGIPYICVPDMDKLDYEALNNLFHSGV